MKRFTSILTMGAALTGTLLAAEAGIDSAPATTLEAEESTTAIASGENRPAFVPDAPEEIRRQSLLPHKVLDEEGSNCREELRALFLPLVRNCHSPREAVLRIASQIGQRTGVYYSMERRTPCMSAQEALAEKKVSCTGQSILLVSALRAVGIPARAVGVLSWGHIQGNHTWCEAWFDGDWHMIEFNEKDFNSPWVMENIGMLNPDIAAQRIYAAIPEDKKQGADKGSCRFPAVWHWPKLGQIPAVDVTERYMKLAQDWYAQAGQATDCQRLMLELSPRPEDAMEVQLLNAQGEKIDSAILPRRSDDVRYYAKLQLPRKGEYRLYFPALGLSLPVRANESPVQILPLQLR